MLKLSLILVGLAIDTNCIYRFDGFILMLHNQRIMKRLAKYSRAIVHTDAFALPTVLIASIIMLTVLLVAVTAVSSIRVALNDQYYNQIAMEAGESGVAMATVCLRQNDYIPIWLNNPDPSKRVLKPNTFCDGNINASAPSYVLDNSSIKTTFTVDDVVTDAGGLVRVRSAGNLQLLRTSNASVWRSYNQTSYNQTSYIDNPQLGAGAGWKANGHIGYFLAGNGALYAWGDNGANQIGDSSTGLPAIVRAPVKVVLPSGVTRVKKLFSSGQGASILCILGSDDQAYCRGKPGAGENGLMPPTQGWQRFGLSAGLSAVDLDINGNGGDSACAIASNGQVYCAGENFYGSLGNGQTVASNVIAITSPTRFLLPAGLTAKKVTIKDWITCVIANTDDVYCAGVNNMGQLGQGNTTINAGNGNSVPGRSLLPGGVTAADVKSTYHGSYVGVYYLGSNGSVYMSGHNGQGTANDGNFGGTATTFYSTPRQITTTGYQYSSIFSVGQDGNNNSSLCMIRKTPNPGMVWCIGNNNDGQLGDGTCADKGNWVVYQLPAGETASQTMNIESGYQMNSFMVFTDTGKVFSAGDNSRGKLGSNLPFQACNGTPNEVLLPFRPGSTTERVKAVAIANNDEYTSYILGDDSKVYSSGDNSNGQLGVDDTMANTPVPLAAKVPRIGVSF